jgi:NAD-dependent dihydropyrimidine dehydrogenase PreA subunit
VVVDNDICLHCGACVGTCPSNSLFLHESAIAFLPSCTECGVCVLVCPVGAIDADAEPADAIAVAHSPAGAA